MKYRVKLTFKYKGDNKRYRPGDVWQPAGTDNDKAILQHFVVSEDEYWKGKRKK